MSKKKIIYTVLEALFIGIAPLVLIILEYGNIGKTGEAVGFKLSFTGALLALLILVFIKKTILKKWLNKLNTHIVDDERDVKNKVGDELENIKKHLKRARTVQAVINAAVPIAVFMLVLVMCRGLEREVIRLSGSVGFFLLSYLVGTVFSVLNAREV